MKQEITCLCVCFNEEQHFLRAAIGSVLETVDHIVIVDGSPQGSSTDGTLGYLEELVENNSKEKIVVLTNKFRDLHEQKNTAMQLAKKCFPNTTYFLTLDADEIFKKEDLSEIISYVSVPDAPSVVMFKMYHTWKDLAHYQIGGPFSNPFIRLFKNVEGIKYDPPPAGDEPKDGQGRYLKMDEFYVRNTKYLAIPKVFHVGHSRDVASIFLKILRYANWEHVSIEQALHRVSVNGWMDKGNPEPILSVSLPEGLVNYRNPCEGCNKSRHLIDYCFNHCEVGKTLKRETAAYPLDGLKEVLERAGINQEYK